MRNVVCWDRQQVHRIINPEAESVDEAIFRAVHSDQLLSVAPPVGERFQQLVPGAFNQLSPQQLLVEFLRPDRSHVQLAFYGRAGSGKSHLVHWMRMMIPSTQERLVLTIPKAGTSLRSIVELIIDQLDPRAQPPYRDALNRSGDGVLTREGQRHEVLNQLAQAIREDAASHAEGRAELEAALLQSLPDLFQDAYIRRAHFMQEGSALDALADHVFSVRSQYEPSEERHFFRAEDMPSAATDWRDASKPARSALQVLMLEPDVTLPAAAVIVNRNLDGAIARALSFTGDRVTQLLTELRRHLRSEGRELVLLIEDIARLQGIDRALLQALLTQGDDEICNIRWVLAATRGFFETIADTVYGRMSLLVDMDRSGSGRSRVTQKSLTRFAGRYLNAVRIGATGLTDWSRRAEPDDAAPNACDPCQYRDECHRVFKASEDGFGLYPFTAKALWNMADRADDHFETRFNPRVLQRDVLVRVLDEHETELRSGMFPPLALLKQLGDVKELGTVQVEQLRHSVPGTMFDRALTLHELWDGSAALTRLPDGLADAFGLPQAGAPPDADSFAYATTYEDDVSPTPPRNASMVDPRVRHLDEWVTGAILEQGKIPGLREMVFAAIDAAIDWDGEGLERSAFAGTSGGRPFRRQSIRFARQDTRPVDPPVLIRVPGDDVGEEVFRRTALALQGMLQSRDHNDTWTFPHGAEMLAAFQEVQADWAAEVVRQLKKLPGKEPTWDPVVAAAELLGIGACLTGVRASGGDPELLDVALERWPEDSPKLSPSLQRLAQKLAKEQEDIVERVRSLASGTKGGQAGAFLDPGAVLPALKALRLRGWKLSQTPPERDPRGGWDGLAKTYRDVAGALDSAAKAERDARLAWLAEIDETFGRGARRNEIAAQLTAVLDAASEVGIPVRIKALREKLDDFVSVQFDDALRAASALAEEDDALASLPQYGRVRGNALEASRALAAEARAFMTQLSAEVGNLEAQFAGENSVRSELEAIGASLNTIAQDLAAAR